MADLLKAQVTRPDGNVMWECHIHPNNPETITLGKLVIQSGQIMLKACPGSVVHPTASWIGDMAFSVKPVAEE